ncbi:MAG TPA: hypothetical protein VFW33_07035 [Gemmataceae bacterium]|nr:hypothetical protein [Gemmataceae bacterium]
MRFSYLWATAAVPLAGLLALACCFAADPDRGRSADGKLVVHEWGTFSTFSGSDGKNLKFNPYDNDLPDFVHAYLTRDSKAGPKGGTISLETPVIYFYPDRPMSASVHVEFPRGTITEWYPHAARTDTKLTWDGIQLLPDESVKLLTEKKTSRYYAARETDAAPLRVKFRTEDVLETEHEKFLFYRGVGTFDMPLSVRAGGDGKCTVTWRGGSNPGEMILVRVENGKLRFQPFRLGTRVKSGLLAEVKVPAETSTEEKLGQQLVKMLTARGLKDKEARAMVETWRAAWFGEEGTRVLYLLPDEITTDLLPLTIEPKPTSLVRVLVGRHDVLTPELEKDIDSWEAILLRTEGKDPARVKAEKELSRLGLGRYEEAALHAAQARLERR